MNSSFKIKKYLVFIILVATLLLPKFLLARDIDVDQIYLKKTNPGYQNLIYHKTDAYFAAGSNLIAKNVIFSFWLDNERIVFVQEAAGYNKIFIHNLRSKHQKKICSLDGNISVAKLTFAKKYLVLKQIIISKNNKIKNKIVIINLRTSQMQILKSLDPFLDFSIYPQGNQIIRVTKKGLLLYDCDYRFNRIIADDKSLPKYKKTQTTLVYYAPNRKSFIFLTGGGGFYRCYLCSKNKIPRQITSCSSCSEFFWLNSQQIVYRNGGTGHFFIEKYNLISGEKTKLCYSSYNTSLQYQKNKKILSFLQDQVIQYRLKNSKKIVNTGLEGDEVFFSPGGQNFSSIYMKNLFVTNLLVLENSRIKMPLLWQKIVNSYQSFENEKVFWQNKYTKNYIKRKKTIYGKLIKSY